MITGYSVNRIEIVIKVLIEFAAAIRAFAAKLLQRRLEPSLLDSQRTKSPLVDVQRQLEPLLLGSYGPDRFVGSFEQKMQSKRNKKTSRPIFFEGSSISSGNSLGQIRLLNGSTQTCRGHLAST